MRSPVHLDVRVRGDQGAVGAVHHIEEAVLVGLDHHLPRLAIDFDIREHMLVDTVHVVHVVGGVLVVARNLSGLGTDGEHTRGIQAI